MSRTRRSLLTVAFAMLAVAATVALGAAPASAKIVHPFLFSFDGSSTPAGAFSLPAGLAVDNSGGSSGGDVYVGDTYNRVIDKFSVTASTASYDCQITGAGPATSSASECDAADPGVPGGSVGAALGQGAVDPSGNLFYPDYVHSAVDEFSATGKYLTQWLVPSGGRPRALALDSAGDIFVANTTGGVVDEYVMASSSWQTFATGTPAGGFSRIQGIAVDDDPSSPAFGDVYVSDTGAGVVDVFNSSGLYLSQLSATPAGSFTSPLNLAVDPLSGDLYVAEGQTVAVFTAAGSFQSQFAVDGYAEGVALNTTTGDLFVSTSNNLIDVYGPAAIIPDVSTGQATGVQQTSATLNGHVDPAGGGNVTSCRFEYVTDTAYNASAADPYSAGSTVPCTPATPYASATDVSAAASGLSPGTIYHFRVEASNANGILNYGADQTFTTPGPPAVDSATVVAGTRSATVTAQVNPFGFETSCQVQYVSASDYASSGYAGAATAPCSPADLGSGFGDQKATASLTGLQVNSTYHYRVLATNQAGTTTGPDETFATWGVNAFSFAASDQSGNPYTQAGGHPWEVTSSFTLNTTASTVPGAASPDGTLKDVVEPLPAGLIGNPTAAARCSDYDLSNETCSPSAQIGMITIHGVNGDNEQGALYNMVPPSGVPAQFGAYINGSIHAYLTAAVRTGSDYGIDIDSLNITGNALNNIESVTVTMWGVPADPSHNAQRHCAGGGTGCASTAPLTPFLTMPTTCAGAQSATLKVDSYQDPGDFANATASLPANTGCDKLDFTPSISVQPDTTAADSPSGLAVDLHLPQNDNPSGLAEAALKDASVTLPEGVSVDPSAANGRSACSPAQIGIDNPNDQTCPNASKVGSVEIDTPVLPDPLKGGIYIAQQDQNPFGSLLAIYVTAQADGVLVKLAGHVVPDPRTGQLTTTFSDNPQLPFSDLKLDFWGGPQGVLATPDKLGAYTSTASLAPWSGQPATSLSDSFQITSGAVSGFAPTFTAGSQNPQAGAYSPFAVSFSRSDTDQYLSGLSVKLPDGVLARLAGVQECSDAQLAAAAAKTGAAERARPSCPAASLVGTATTGAGAGPDPLFLGGKVYLTGPYKGAPYGLAVVVPALAGPFDLGTVVVRQALHIDPTTAQVTDVSDPFPTILDGIPLRLRRVDVLLNRPGFTINPTSCDVMAVTGTLSSTLGISAPVSSRFQVGGCAGLGFSPKLQMKLTGPGRTRSGDHPNLIATVTQRRGQANIRRVRAALPLSLALDPNNSSHVCPFATAQAVNGGSVGCPASTIVGHAEAVTPLLSRPLSGPVYLVQGIRMEHGVQIHTLPSLLIALRGQIALDLRAQSSVSGGKLVSTFPVVPDAPITRFTLQINGGRHGILVITGRGRSICGSPQVAAASLAAQNGKAVDPAVKLGTPCRAAHHTRRHRRHSARHRRHG